MQYVNRKVIILSSLVMVSSMFVGCTQNINKNNINSTQKVETTLRDSATTTQNVVTPVNTPIMTSETTTAKPSATSSSTKKLS